MSLENYSKEELINQIISLRNEIDTLKHEIQKSKTEVMSAQIIHEKLSSFFYDHQAIMLLLDPLTLDIIDINNSAQRFYGFKKELLITKNLLFLCDTSENYGIDKVINLINDKNNSLETKHILSTGEIKYVEVRASPLFISDNKQLLLAIINDVTSKKNTEEALNENIDKFRTLFEESPVGIIVSKGSILYAANKTTLKLFGYESEEQVVGKRLPIFIDESDQKRLIDWILKWDYSVPENSKIRIIAIHSSGKKFNLEIQVGPFNTKKGRFFVAFLTDITEKLKSEEELRKLSMAVSQSSASILITDTDGKIEYINPSFTEITGYTFDECAGMNPRFLKSGEMSSESYKELWNTIKSGKEWLGEFHNKKKNGELYWELASISPIKNEVGIITHFIAIKEDITERKTIENELLNAMDKAVKSDKLKSEFLAQMSHEIRTPINTILSFLTLIREDIGQSVTNDLETSFTIINKAGKRLIRTIDLIILMAEISTNSFELSKGKFSLCKDVILKVYDEYKEDAVEKGLKFEIIENCESSIILADKFMVHTIFSNLIDNAIKYTSKGSVLIEINESNNHISVEVVDTGIGISEEYFKNLFTSFSQEQQGYTRQFEGNGLGLALVKKYVDLNNASIEVKSKKNKGSTFKVNFRKEV